MRRYLGLAACIDRRWLRGLGYAVPQDEMVEGFQPTKFMRTASGALRPSLLADDALIWDADKKDQKSDITGNSKCFASYLADGQVSKSLRTSEVLGSREPNHQRLALGGPGVWGNVVSWEAALLWFQSWTNENCAHSNQPHAFLSQRLDATSSQVSSTIEDKENTGRRKELVSSLRLKLPTGISKLVDVELEMGINDRKLPTGRH